MCPWRLPAFPVSACNYKRFQQGALLPALFYITPRACITPHAPCYLTPRAGIV